MTRCCKMRFEGLGLSTLLVNVATTVVRQVIAGLLTFAATILIARAYGPEGNGIYAVVLLLPTLLATLLSLGIGPANVYFLGSDQVSVREAVRTSCLIGGCLVLFGACGGAGLIVLGDQVFPGVPPMLLWLSLAAFPVVLINGFLASVFQGLQQFRVYNGVAVLQPAVFFVLLCAVVLSDDRRLIVLVAMQLLAGLIALAFASWFIRQALIDEAHPATSTGYSRSVMDYGWKAHLGNIISFVNYRTDIFLINFFMAPAFAGLYVIAVSLAEKLWLLSSAVSTVLFPRLSQLGSQEDKRQRLTPIVSRFVFLITLVASGLLALLAFPIVPLVFGEDYRGSIVPMLILLPGVVAVAGARVWANDIAARGRPELNMYVAGVTAITNITGNILLIPVMGISGAAFATSASYSICALMTLVIYTRLSGNVWWVTLSVNAADVRALVQALSGGGAAGRGKPSTPATNGTRD